MPSLRAIKEQTEILSAGFSTPSYSRHEYVANDVGTVIEKKSVDSSSSGVVDGGSHSADRSTRVAIEVVEDDCLLAARKMLPAKSLFQKTIATFLDKVFLNKSPSHLIANFLACLGANRINVLFTRDKKLNVSALKTFKSLTGNSSLDMEIKVLMSLSSVQEFISFFDESDQSEKNFDIIKRNLLREMGDFLHKQTDLHNRVLVLNMAHPSRRGGRPDSREQEEHLYRAIAGLTALEEHEEFKSARLHKDNFTSVTTLLVRDATVFRQGDEYRILYPSEQYQVDLLYSAAPSTGSVNKREQGLKRAIHAQLLTAKEQGYKNLLLNAFGCCGDFKNDPITVAQLYGKALRSSEFRCAFDRVHFAIISDPVHSAAFRAEFAPSSLWFSRDQSLCRSAFRRLVPRSSTSNSVSGSNETSASVLSSTRETDDLYQQQGEGLRSGSAEIFKLDTSNIRRGKVERSASAEFFKLDALNTRRRTLTPTY